MKKLLISLVVIALIFIWVLEKRKFYPIGNGSYVTVWKTVPGVCYIIPNKYYGLMKPTANFIETTNDNYLVLFFSEELPDKIIYWENRQGMAINVDSQSNGKGIFINYNSNHDSLHNILYKVNPKTVRDLKANAYLLDIDIEASSAFDKNGKDL